jgi:hypothetical protein
MSAAPPTGPPDPAVAQLLQAQIDMLCRLVPGTKPEMAYKALEAAMQQEEGLAQVWVELVEGPKPAWQLRLSPQGGNGRPLVFQAPKRMVGTVTGQDILFWSLQLGVLTSPFLRAALLLSGWLMEFAGSDGKSKLLGPDGKLVT